MGNRAGGHAHEAAAAQLSAWCKLFEGCERISDVTPRQPATVLGVIQRMRLVPGESMEVVITDGTARLRAVFTGEPISGIELGHGLRLEGTVGFSSGMPVMRNPSWRMVRDPYACATAAAEAQLLGGRAAPRGGVRGSRAGRQPISA